MSVAGWVNEAITQNVPGDKWKATKAYKVHLLITKDDDGTYSAVALNLPGAGSCGATEVEAVSNATEAVRGVVESHLEDSEDIPWTDSSEVDIPFGAEQKWIIVHA